MKWYLYFISLSWVAMGSALIIYPDRSREKLHSLYSKINPKHMAILPFLIGLLMLISASAARTRWLVITLGILSCLKGIYFFLAPARHIQSIIQWWFFQASAQSRTLWVLIFYSLGLTLFYQIG